MISLQKYWVLLSKNSISLHLSKYYSLPFKSVLTFFSYDFSHFLSNLFQSFSPSVTIVSENVTTIRNSNNMEYNVVIKNYNSKNVSENLISENSMVHILLKMTTKRQWLEWCWMTELQIFSLIQSTRICELSLKKCNFYNYFLKLKNV